MSRLESTAREAVKAWRDGPGAYTNPVFQHAFAEMAKAVDDADSDVALSDLYREKAHDEHHRDGECEIDDGAIVSFSDDGGAYVQSWVWVEAPEADEIELEDMPAWWRFAEANAEALVEAYGDLDAALKAARDGGLTLGGGATPITRVWFDDMEDTTEAAPSLSG